MKSFRTGLLAMVLMLPAGFLFAQVKHKPAKKAVGGIAASISRGRVVYMSHCITCHQADGSGVPNMNPPLIQTTYVLGDKTKLINIVFNGFNEDVEINGQTYSNNMPSHAFLTDQQIADVLTFVRNNFTNKASAVTVSEVKKLRPAAPKPAAG